MKIVFVCLGNICRSPLAEGIMRHLVEKAGLRGQIDVCSAGTGAWHAGEPPDPRSTAVAGAHGVTLAGQSGRQVADADYFDSDLILAMDQSNLETLRARQPRSGCKAQVALLLAPPRGDGGEVPDPYYGGERGFDDVYELVHGACEKLLVQLRLEI
ncbi:MAG: low molecular weight phosphotyrosine protein phosphatase [Myxococcota bacterium]|nr:low molecular weight phosphotyrosine protein phosphatase [Myxococcota bacterium]